MTALRRCSVDGCQRRYYARSWCHTHYRRLYLGIELLPTRLVDPEKRFWAKVNKTETCWLWTGALGGHPQDKLRYGVFRFNRRNTPAHRYSFVAAGGVIPEGFQIDHLCRVTRCVRPDHLEAVTPAENCRRAFGFSGINARKTHCINGHPFDASNTFVRVDREGRGRDCRECKRIRDRIRRQMRRAS